MGAQQVAAAKGGGFFSTLTRVFVYAWTWTAKTSSG